MDPVYYTQGPNGQQIPVYNNATPGFTGAIQDMVSALARAFAPQAITQRRQKIEQGVSQAAPGPSAKLGDQF